MTMINLDIKVAKNILILLKKKPVSTASLASTPGTAGGCTAAAGPACARGTAPEIRQPLLNPF